MTPAQKLLLAELAFAIIIVILVNITRKPKPKKSHRELLTGTIATDSDSVFVQNREKYLAKIKSGDYKTKELICRDRYDTDQDFYRCLEEVYFS